MPGPAPGKKKALAMIQTGKWPTGEQLCRKGSDGQLQARSMSWQQRRPVVSWAVWRKTSTVDWGKQLTPSTLTLIRLHPEYCVRLWAYKKDSDELEWVQQRVTGMAEGGWRTGLWGETEGAELAQPRGGMASGQLPPACSHQWGHHQDTSRSCFAGGHCRKSQQLLFETGDVLSGYTETEVTGIIKQGKSCHKHSTIQDTMKKINSIPAKTAQAAKSCCCTTLSSEVFKTRPDKALHSVVQFGISPALSSRLDSKALCYLSAEQFCPFVLYGEAEKTSGIWIRFARFFCYLSQRRVNDGLVNFMDRQNTTVTMSTSHA